MCLLKECVKFIVLAFNLVFLIVGAALITLGAIYLSNFNDVTNAIPETYNAVHLIPILTIIVGSIIFVISFLGCCGAVRANPCMLTTYGVILLIIFIAQVALGVFAFIEIKDEKDLRTAVNQNIDKVFRKYNTSTEVVDFIQKELKCCGTTGPSFWIPDIIKEIPKSCYPGEDNKKPPYQAGCQGEFFSFLKNAAQVIGIVVLVLAATEVLGAIFGFCLANSVRNELRRSEYY